MPALSGLTYAIATFLTIDAIANLDTLGHRSGLELTLAGLIAFAGGLWHLASASNR